MKNKFLTFSYDDGVIQDRRLVPLLDKYGLKATFNLNSGWLGKTHHFRYKGETFVHQKVEREEVPSLYRNHEVAAHTLTHPKLPTLSDEEILFQVEEDRKVLSSLVGYEVVGMAYPGGTNNHNERTEKLIRGHTGIRYCRTVDDSHSFAIPENPYELCPSIHHLSEQAFDLCREFVQRKTDKPQLLYIWGHSYELDLEGKWEQLEELFKLLSGHDDIVYGTNAEVLERLKTNHMQNIGELYRTGVLG